MNVTRRISRVGRQNLTSLSKHIYQSSLITVLPASQPPRPALRWEGCPWLFPVAFTSHHLANEAEGRDLLTTAGQCLENNSFYFVHDFSFYMLIHIWLLLLIQWRFAQLFLWERNTLKGHYTHFAWFMNHLRQPLKCILFCFKIAKHIWNSLLQTKFGF